MLIKCANTLVDRLWEIYTAILKKGVYFAPWKTFTTIVLRKLGKPRYDTPKAYRLIALLNTMPKVLMSIITEQLTFHSEKLNLLPTHHYGGRPACTTTDAMHMLTYQIKDAWRKRRVTSVLFLDIEGAFPNAVNERLIHNMKKRRVPTALVKFTKNLLQDRFTMLKFDDFTSERIPIDNSIGQGDPLSMVLYQYYNADILDIPAGSNESAMAYVDNAILIATGENFIETHQTLMNMMTRPNGALDWSKDHNSRFKFSKLALMDFAHRNNKKERRPMTLFNTVISPVKSAKYLGVFFNQHLDWGTQCNYALEKGTKWASQIRQAAAPSWGITPKHAQQLYRSVAIPRTLYMQPMILTDFHNSWVNRWGESLLCHGPADVGRRRRFFRYSWASRCRPGAEAIFRSHFLRTFPDDFNPSGGSDIINPVRMEHVNSCRLDLVGHLCNLVRTEQVNSCRPDLVGHLCYPE